ncbi:MAG TPA: uroporphyrinogen decarboxylase family protein [Candidatus Hydrogenedentes bacterium]|nr:uroporphyrinogen decarboxylase family protein [Candidatus Hydrogenedentota bacterium]HQH52920.1 uroporphyrinogen decarboxylase family protein [Candidatus Hydrogenedentota bacterium]
MTPRERFIAALERRPIPGRVPHFELVFFLTMEAFGKIHPSQRHYAQWDQMTESERALHRNEMAEIHVQTARKYEHSAIFLHPNPNTEDEALRLIDLVREKSGNDYFLMMHGDPTYSIPSGSDMLEQAAWFYERMDDAMDTADRRVDEQLAACERLKAHGGLDGFALCADYCFNDNPFLRPDLFAVLITPYLKRVVAGMREMGFHVIKHTDGNIMPILDQLVDAGPHALHSLDPQGGVDIAEVKRLYGGKVCLIGNVNCGLLTSGTDEEVIESARYCIKHGMPGGGYIFSTSNCAFTGLPLERYELMWKVWHDEAIYPET